MATGIPLKENGKAGPAGAFRCLYFSDELVKVFLVFIVTFLYLLAWSVVKPIGQSPDEFSHAVKVYSIFENPWIPEGSELSISGKYYNLLLEYQKIHKIPFHPKIQLTRRNIEKMKSHKWYVDKNFRKATTAYSYPPLYYWFVGFGGYFFTHIFTLNPYESFYAYRLISVIMAAFLWVLFYQKIKFSELNQYSKWVYFFLLLNPMMAFIASSVNPDAIFVPLTGLLLLYGSETCKYGKNYVVPILLFILTGLCKPAALVAFPAFGAMLLMLCIFRKISFLELVKRGSLFLVLPFLVLYGAYYYWLPMYFTGSPVYMTLAEYLKLLPERIPNFWYQYWGQLGWLDYGLPGIYYQLLFVLVIVNFIAALIGFYKDKGNAVVFFFLFFLILYIGGILAGEFVSLSKSGFVIQGRYWHPAALGLAILVFHKIFWPRILMLGCLLIMNIMLVFESINRYFSGNWDLFFRSLPFS